MKVTVKDIVCYRRTRRNEKTRIYYSSSFFEWIDETNKFLKVVSAKAIKGIMPLPEGGYIVMVEEWNE